MKRMEAINPTAMQAAGREGERECACKYKCEQAKIAGIFHTCMHTWCVSEQGYKTKVYSLPCEKDKLEPSGMKKKPTTRPMTKSHLKIQNPFCK